MLSVLLQATDLPSSAGLPVPSHPICPDCQPPPNTLPTPACHLLARRGAAYHLATTTFPAPGVLPLTAGGHGQGARLAPGAAGSAGPGGLCPGLVVSA